MIIDKLYSENVKLGIDKKIKPRLDEIYTVPKLGEGESLNVGVAMGIILSKIL